MKRACLLLAFLTASGPTRAATHAELIGTLDDAALKRGEQVYRGLCITCHGTTAQPGTLPTSRVFHRDALKNGADPYAMYLTVTKGFGQMPPWPQFSAREVYDAIHYLRETQIKPNNPSQYFAINPDYLAGLPAADLGAQVAKQPEAPAWQRMDYGNALHYTLEAAPGNIARKGIAVRLDPGAGGVALGRAWVLYDHDTMRLAAAWTGAGFIDGKSIAFDQSHGTHPSIVGTRQVVNPPGPGIACPGTDSFADPRQLGTDGRPYGPLPRDWARYRGLYHHGGRVVLSYTIGEAEVLESPGLIEAGGAQVFTRTFNIGRASADLLVHIAPLPAMAEAEGTGAGLVTTNGQILLRIPAAATPGRFRVLFSAQGFSVPAAVSVEDLAALTRGGPPQWPGAITKAGQRGNDDGPLAVDHLPVPNLGDNPWRSWMRLGGFDFLPGGHSAAVCTWLGDVWIVDGIDGDLSRVTWRRIAAGLFQPLGVKVVGGAIYVTCRDQLARLHDLDGDGETDFIESFNSDHQVTEHFHEFAMGLQTDAAGNFYYAKSACHGKPAVVPQHGTLLRVSADGARTDILATGFRAANGVCVNGDGTFYVTDQEGFWMPENRINHVRPSDPPRFFGNQLGYAPPADTSDAAMEPPLAWIANEYDRSPAELVRVKSQAWGSLDGGLLNLSYGMGRAYVVLSEERNGMTQGAMFQLPLDDFGTGIMRGRFHPGDGHLYACGMYAWAGNRHEDGGFLRLRATGKPWRQPVALHAEPGRLTLTFSDALDPASAVAENLALRVWGLQRTKNYGSPHLNERTLPISGLAVHDGRTLELTVPDFAPTPCYALTWNLRGADGAPCRGDLQGTLHPARVTPARKELDRPR
jgi:mono/diheme cytochrome c family protein